MPEACRLGAIVLAAGPSTRMGRAKQLIDSGGTALVARAADAALGAGARPVAVVLGANAQAVAAALRGRPVLAPVNADWRSGMASSIRCGLEALLAADPGIEAVLVAPCDIPGFDARSAAALAQAHWTRGVPAAVRHADGRLGAPAVFGRADFPALAALTGDEGARGLLNRADAQAAGLDLPALSRDLDTPADHEAWARGQRR
jgi:molybdenum cofactor cytidylyltransferase